MIDEKFIIADDLQDDIGSLLDEIGKEEGWTKSKAELRNELVRLLKKSKYIDIVGSPYRYHAMRVGDSYLYDVPLYKRGYLEPFRGKRVRIVCVGSGRYTRDYMAGVVSDTPVGLIVHKLKHHYHFPDYISESQVVYRTRRYIVCIPPKHVKIAHEREPNGYLDLTSWPGILIDGKDGDPKIKLRFCEDGTTHWALLGGQARVHEGFKTVREAVMDSKLMWF